VSVFTRLSADDLTPWLAREYGLALTALSETTDGIENSNFFVDATDGNGRPVRRVLTIFESVPDNDLPWFCDLLTHLGQAGLPVPAPYPTRDGERISRLKEKSCVLVPRLAGHHVKSPGGPQCRAIGEMLARLHKAGEDFQPRRSNPFGDVWRTATCQRLAFLLPEEDLQLITLLLEHWRLRESTLRLPISIVHADLFHDNALFTGYDITGIIDFYYACEDTCLYDLAIVTNDWCRDSRKRLDRRRQASVLAGYESVRALTPSERELLPLWQVFAALRFWLSRLDRAHADSSGRKSGKSPDEMKAILLESMAESGLDLSRLRPS
jgi:homoserine kinase type II